MTEEYTEDWRERPEKVEEFDLSKYIDTDGNLYYLDVKEFIKRLKDELATDNRISVFECKEIFSKIDKIFGDKLNGRI